MVVVVVVGIVISMSVRHDCSERKTRVQPVEIPPRLD